MSRYHSYLRSAAGILEEYKGQEPFASFLKKFFAEHKKFGSKDRKQVSQLCYSYFRLGKALPALAVEEKLLSALFLCSSGPQDILDALRPQWNEAVSQPIPGKIALAGLDMRLQDIFPWTEELSEPVDAESFSAAHLQQPDLFLRLRPGREQEVKKRLHDTTIPFEEINNHCLALPNNTRIDELLTLNRDAVVQDRSSQQVGRELLSLQDFCPRQVWDCCAASGGKSIMLYDLFPGIQLTVSDIRESILVNLRNRFRAAGILHYKAFVADLTNAAQPDGKKYDCIVADVPCTGSGTWGRTPEQLFYFKKEKIGEYARRQRQIVQHVTPSLLPGGFLVYITCSVFRQENGDQVAAICRETGLETVIARLIKGYGHKADTLYMAVLRKK